MSSKSKIKGNTWERDVVNHLSLLYKEKFVRCPTSGAMIGGLNSVRKQFLQEGQIRMMKGDIIPPDKWKHFNCECKSYAEFPFHQLVQGECKQLETWLSQLIEVADIGDFNVLMFKITRKGKYIAVPQATYWYDLPYSLYHSIKHGTWQIFDYDAFFEHNNKKIKSLSTKGTT